MTFSQRNGLIPSSKQIQVDSIDKELRFGLWNLIKMNYLDQIPSHGRYSSVFEEFADGLWADFYKLLVDAKSKYHVGQLEFIRERFMRSEWFEVYDFLEYLSGLDRNDVNIPDFRERINTILEREFSAYRFIDGFIIPISNKIEVSEIETALSGSEALASLAGANVHLLSALEKLGDRLNPDYRNSIKESISAVESACRIITGETTLGKALNKLNSTEVVINEQVRQAFEKLYASTNTKDSGVRHAFVEGIIHPEFSDAKLMLVICSAFINFLILKFEGRFSIL